MGIGKLLGTFTHCCRAQGVPAIGSLYYMANDLRVPNYTRYAVGRWGLCADEYASNDHWPPQLYVRVSNRLRGEVILTQNTLANPRSKPDGVSMGCWEFDQHTVSRHAIQDPHNSSRAHRSE